ncbi:hypothetical protein OS493_014588 [Desmophyllum pertusum]|uniref:C2H2-type domain-containing protein n=1 Tax=Desmophyllum pertusum TaxID=174260 RepID=A0A9X0CLB4_9CNID|nr:hypothetical protein OS493_014588 [Desmophyllum pertusum]
MVLCGMEKMEDVPSKFQLPLKSEGSLERCNWLHKVIREFLREFVFDTQESDKVIQEVNRLDRQQREGYTCRVCGRRYQGDAWHVRHEIKEHGLRVQDTPEKDTRNSLAGYFKCPNVNCGLVFRTNATLKRHQQREHGVIEIVSQAVNSKEKENESKEDYKFNYHKAKIRFGLLLADINDAIREGDGKRMLNLYKKALLLYKCYGHTKYSYSTLLFLTKV